MGYKRAAIFVLVIGAYYNKVYKIGIDRGLCAWERIVKISSNGCDFVKKSTYNPGASAATLSKVRPRGEIRTFSRASALRLRRALLYSTLDPGLSRRLDVFGVTLTIPWQIWEGRFKRPAYDSLSAPLVLDAVALTERYKAVFNRFGVLFRRAFPASAAIFRQELQRRDVPHCHLVLYLSPLDAPHTFVDDSPERLRVWIKQQFLMLWMRALEYDFGKGSVEYFIRYGVDVRRLSDQAAMFRYVADHTSKHKREQMGYRGKQWGFLNRDCLVSYNAVRFAFRDDSELVFFRRSLRRLCRFVVRDRRRPGDGACVALDCDFGSRKSFTVDGLSIRFVGFPTSERLLSWIARKRVRDRWWLSLRDLLLRIMEPSDVGWFASLGILPIIVGRAALGHFRSKRGGSGGVI